MIHPIFHISQLKPLILYYTPVNDSLLVVIDLKPAATTPQAIIDHCLIKKGNTVVPQAKLTWVGLPATATTSEDYHVVKAVLPRCTSLGPNCMSSGGRCHTWR